MFKTSALIFILFFQLTSFAGYYYSGVNFSINGVISTFDEYNGATGWAPGLSLGVKRETLAFEFFFKPVKQQTRINSVGINYDVTVDNMILGLGMRLTLFPRVDMILGMNAQNIHATSSPALNYQLLDKSFVGYYLGGGYNQKITETLKGQFDLVYYNGDVNYGTLSLIFTLCYKFGFF